MAAVGVAGLVTGALTALALYAPAEPLLPSADDAPTGTPTKATEVPAKPAPVPTSDASVLLAWTSGRLPDGFADAVGALPAVEELTVVAGDRVDLVAARDADGRTVEEHRDGWAVPLDALAIDPGSYAAIVPVAEAAAVAKLAPGEALLGATSAELRGLGPGATLELAGGHRVVVRAVVEDTAVGAAELVVARGSGLPIGTERFVLLTYHGDRAALEAAIRDLTDVEVRVRGPGETSYLRHGDAVLPQAIVKREFGEFAYRLAGDGRRIEQDPDWRVANLVTEEVPLLGAVTCHRRIVDQLRGALGELADSDLGYLVDPDGFAGCHAARLVSEEGGLSRHAWGIAVDLNAQANPTGVGSGQDQRLVEVFTRWGFTWGGFWLVPDPMHLEYRGEPAPVPGKIGGGD